jgi:hypothetical protein
VSLGYPYVRRGGIFTASASRNKEIRNHISLECREHQLTFTWLVPLLFTLHLEDTSYFVFVVAVALLSPHPPLGSCSAPTWLPDELLHAFRRWPPVLPFLAQLLSASECRRQQAQAKSPHGDYMLLLSILSQLHLRSPSRTL